MCSCLHIHDCHAIIAAFVDRTPSLRDSPIKGDGMGVQGDLTGFADYT